MKIRSGFVSNSSSSSYIIIGNSSKKEHIPDEAYEREYDNVYTLNLPHRDYTCEFGWERCIYSNIMERLNFAAIQTRYVTENPLKYEDWTDKIITVVKEDFGETHPGCELNVEFDYGKNSYDCYIDHQSSAIEGENTEMFDSEGNMYDFIFDAESYIQGDNDNY